MPEVENFITLDLNGWLDHVVPPAGKAQALGLRSCLYKHEDRWLFGAQALAAARYKEKTEDLIDAISALDWSAGHGDVQDSKRTALPDALWQLVGSAQTAETPFNLALIIPDDRYLGKVEVQKDGKTGLECLHNAIMERRPPGLTRCRLELIWRSVAAFEAVHERESMNREGKVLVISVNRRVFWTELELKHWSRGGGHDGPLCIVRKPVMDDCSDNESWTCKRIKSAEKALQETCRSENIRQWTRLVEVMATDISEQSWKQIDIDPNGLENQTWMEENHWKQLTEIPVFRPTEADIPEKLKRRIVEFCGKTDQTLLGIVIECPAPEGMTDTFTEEVRRLSGSIKIFHINATECALAANRLAQKLGKDPERPAWLDAVPPIDIKVRKGSCTDWQPVIKEDEIIPAGELYASRDRDDQVVEIAPGVNEICLHLRRGRPSEEKRYSRVPARPSEHLRKVRARARTRPLSGEVRIQIVEDHDDGKHRPVSEAGVKWSQLEKSEPESLKSIPELYIFPSDKSAWNSLQPLLEQVVQQDSRGQQIPVALKDELYETTQEKWNEGVFPLGSDGRPPRFNNSSHYDQARRLLLDATGILTRELEHHAQNENKAGIKATNRLHMPLTWLFVGCPEKAVKILLEAIRNPDQRVGRSLLMDNEYSAWSVYSGFGRAVSGETELKVAFDELVKRWERDSDKKQDKFLLAAISHPMARRLAASKVLNESRDRFDRVKGFLDRHLDNLSRGECDPRPRDWSGKPQPRPGLELRYITMGYRGLCQVRYKNRKWFPTDSKETEELADKLSKITDKYRIPKLTRDIVDRTLPYLTGKGQDPAMPSGF